MRVDAKAGYVALLQRLRDEMNDEVAKMSSDQRARFVREGADRLARTIPLPDYAGRAEQTHRQVR